MLHLDTTLNRIKALLTDTSTKAFLDSYGLNNVILPPHIRRFGNESGLESIEIKLDIAIEHCLQLIPSSLINLFDTEDLIGLMTDDLKRYLILNIWAAGINQTIDEGDIFPYVENLINVVSVKEASQGLNLNKEEINNIRNNYDSAINLPRNNDAQNVTSSLMKERGNLPNYTLPFNAFISVFSNIHNELKHNKGKRPSVESYKMFSLNSTPQRKLQNRFYQYFDATLHNLSIRERNINKVIFEREYSLVLASQIDNVTKGLSGSFGEWSRRVLSLASLLPTVEGRIQIIEQYKSHQLLILEGNRFGVPSIQPKLATLYESMLKLADDLLSMALIVLPIMEIKFLSELKNEEKPFLNELSNNEPLYLRMEDSPNIDNTMIEINRIHAIYTKNRLGDVQSLLNKFLNDDDHTIQLTEPVQYSYPSILDADEIERIGKCIRISYFSDFLKYDI